MNIKIIFKNIKNILGFKHIFILQNIKKLFSKTLFENNYQT